MSMRFAPQAIFVVVILGVSACDTSDPRRGGFLGGLGGMLSGSYDKRIQERQTELSKLKEQKEGLEKELSERQREEADVSAEKEAVRMQLDAAEDELKRLRAELEATQQREEVDRSKLKLIEQELEALEREYAELQHNTSEPTAGKSRRLVELEQKISTLEKLMDEAVLSSVGLSEQGMVH